MEECSLVIYLTHSLLGGVVSPCMVFIIRRIAMSEWSLDDVFFDVIVGLMEGVVVTFLICLHKAAAQ
jgi:hypothetical protein